MAIWIKYPQKKNWSRKESATSSLGYFNKMRGNSLIRTWRKILISLYRKEWLRGSLISRSLKSIKIRTWVLVILIYIHSKIKRNLRFSRWKWLKSIKAKNCRIWTTLWKIFTPISSNFQANKENICMIKMKLLLKN